MTTLDTILSRPLTLSAEAPDPLRAARFTMRTEHVHTESGSECPNARAIVREDTGAVLGLCGTRYTIVQPAEGIELAQALAGSTPIGSCTVLGRGADVILTARGEEYQLGGDTLRNETLVRLNNTGRSPVSVSAAVWRKVCSNGAFAPIGRGRVALTIRHTQSATERIRFLARAADAVRRGHETMQETIVRLMGAPIDAKAGELRAYYEKVLPTPTAKDSSKAELARIQAETQRIMGIRREWLGTFLRELDTRGVGDAGPNYWLAANSVTNWAQHRMPIRGERQHPERRTYSNLPGGDAADMTERAFAVAGAMATR